MYVLSFFLSLSPSLERLESLPDRRAWHGAGSGHVCCWTNGSRFNVFHRVKKESYLRFEQERKEEREEGKKPISKYKLHRNGVENNSNGRKKSSKYLVKKKHQEKI